MNGPDIRNFERFFVAGCPQFGDPAQLCPGFSWERLKEKKESCPLESSYDFEVGLKVYPHQRPAEGGQFYCMAGIPLASPPATIPLGYFVAEIPANRYAVFDVPDLEDLAGAFEAIYEDWLPGSGFAACHGYDFEMFRQTPEFQVQIWVPISDKADHLNMT